MLETMPAEALITAGVVLTAALGILVAKLPADATLLGAVALLSALGIVPISVAYSGFGEPVTIAVGGLLVVAAAMRETGALETLATHLLGNGQWSSRRALARLIVPSGVISAFINNTPLVAMLVPTVRDWARRRNYAASAFLMPLSFASILGGLCTLIGTSTNLLVAGLASKLDTPIDLSLFDVAALGVPAFVVGSAYLLLAQRLLPSRSSAQTSFAHPREYLLAVAVDDTPGVAGKSIEAAGLRHLQGVYLVEVQRGDHVMAAVDPGTLLRAGDVLVFAGLIDNVVDLLRHPGLVPAAEESQALQRQDRRLVEAVVGTQSWLVGRTVRDVRFRTRLGAAILAVHRQGERVHSRIGDIQLQAGDTLLLEAGTGFRAARRNDGTFALVSEMDGAASLRRDRAWLAWTALLALVVGSSTGLVGLATASVLASAVLLAGRALTVDVARRSIELPVLISLAAAFGLSEAIVRSGLAEIVGTYVVGLSHTLGPVALLTLIFAITSGMTTILSNAAAAAIMFPIAVDAAARMAIPAHAMVLMLMVAASASFASPLGYQTNLMVYGPGAYRAGDFVRFGLPLQILVGITAITLTCLFWV